MASVGPQLPTSMREKRKHNSDDDNTSSSDSSSSTGPTLPPSAENAVKKARVIGPTLPPGIGSTEKQESAHTISTSKNHENEDSDDDDKDDEDEDDDYGPSLPSAAASIPETHRSTTLGTTAAHTVAPSVQRDDWMMVPPSNGDWSSRIDPTKLKNRKFNTGKGAKGPSTSENAASTWHETPAEKQARLQQEMMGIKSNSSNGEGKKEATSSQADFETRERMREYNKARGPALYEEHQGKQTEKEDDPSARAFDREKDIGGGLQINSTQRRDMLKKASDFGSRFSSAKYL